MTADAGKAEQGKAEHMKCEAQDTTKRDELVTKHYCFVTGVCWRCAQKVSDSWMHQHDALHSHFFLTVHLGIETVTLGETQANVKQGMTTKCA